MTNPCKHPIVILKDIRIDDLKTVIDFIYRGEVNVSQDRLQDVLKVKYRSIVFYCCIKIRKSFNSQSILLLVKFLFSYMETFEPK